jgi:wobble nucleotide-excising tRNase
VQADKENGICLFCGFNLIAAALKKDLSAS